MAANPSIEEHTIFKTLLNDKDKAAIEVWENFLKSQNQVEFFRGLIRTVEKSKKLKTAEKSRPLKVHPPGKDKTTRKDKPNEKGAILLSSLLEGSKSPRNEMSSIGSLQGTSTITSNGAPVAENIAQNVVASRQLFSALQSSAIAKEDNKSIESSLIELNLLPSNSSLDVSQMELPKLIPLTPLADLTLAWPPGYAQRFLPPSDPMLPGSHMEFPQQSFREAHPNMQPQPFGSVGTNSGFLAYNSSTSIPGNDNVAFNQGFSSNFNDLNNSRSNSAFAFAQHNGQTERRNPLNDILQRSSVKSESILLPSSNSDSYSPISPTRGKELLSFLRDGPKSTPAQTTPVKPFQYSGVVTEKTPSSDNQKSKSLLKFLRPNVESTPSKPTTAAVAAIASPLNTQTSEVVETEKLENVKGDVVQNTFRKPVFHRVTRNQVGSLKISIRLNDNDTQTKKDRNPNQQHEIKVVESGFSIRPGQVFNIEWAMPESVMTAAASAAAAVHSRGTPSGKTPKGSADIVVGLVRYGSSVNSPCIISKPIDVASGRKDSTNRSEPFIVGDLSFHAPKAAGQFVFRVFDQSNKESAWVTLATSVVFNVILVDYDVTNNIAFIMDALSEDRTTSPEGEVVYHRNSVLKGLAQLSTVLKGIRNPGKISKGVLPGLQLQKCIHIAMDAIQNGHKIIEKVAEKKLAGKRTLTVGSEGDMFGGDAEVDAAEEGVDEFWRQWKYYCKVHAEAHAVIESAMIQPIVWAMLTPSFQNQLSNLNSLFCPLLQKFYRSFNHINIARKDEFGFIPAPMSAVVKGSSCDAQVAEAAIQQLVSRISPSSEAFLSKRFVACKQLQQALVLHCADATGFLPMNTELAIYGSSANNFGAEGADLDMCLILPPSYAAVEQDAEKRSQIIERLGDALSKIGMLNVKTRATARIPIVEFKDPLTGFDCDISMKNPLALRNTSLLRLYSDLDSRVRSLAFVVKHWAKARHCNSPIHGTLSSYGFILCVLHFLQNRPVPVIPNLQALPADWTDHIPPHTMRGSSQEWFMHASDGSLCDTYYYTPTNAASFDMLTSFAKRNTETIFELLVEFFRYFAWNFDYKRQVVSIDAIDYTLNGSEPVVWKIDKAEKDGWMQHDRLSIEDPFEKWYDVAHVVKPTQMHHIRKEFLRAFTICSRIVREEEPDSIPGSISPHTFLEILCESCEPLAFMKDKDN